MKLRVRDLYPLLFAVLPILLIANRNPGASSLSDVAAVALMALLGCAALYAVLLLLSGEHRFHPILPLIVLAAIIWFYWYDTLLGLGRKLWRGAPAPLVVLLGVLGTGLVLHWLARRPRYLEKLSTFLALTGVLLVGWSTLKIVRSKLAEKQAIARSQLIAELRRPIPVRQGAAAAGPKRDIYLILLDEYANASVLRDVFGFDNRTFEDSLQRLGFTIPRVVQSNYIHTTLSLPSLLNFAPLNALSEEAGAHSNDPTLPNYLLENNRTIAFLKARGYQFLFFPSQWWLSTQHNRNADWEFQAWKGFDLGREATRSDLRRSLVNTTALSLLQRDYAHDADHVRRTFQALKTVPDRSEPTFAFAHVISPHRPYAVYANCESRKERIPLGGPWVPRRRQVYIDQLQCINRLVLDLVGDLIRRSSIAPIIVIQGDHGTPTLGYDKAATPQEVSPSQAHERFGAFGAYNLPGGGAKVLGDSLTLVNVFQKILTYYFGAELRPSPDRLYFSMDETPFSFVEFDRHSYVALPSARGSTPGR